MTYSRVLVVSVLGIGLWLAASEPRPQAQMRPGTAPAGQTPAVPGLAGAETPGPLAMDPSRMLAIAEAQAAGLDWIPGELIVKFKEGVSVEEGARALSVLREPDRTSAVRWVGTALLVRTPGEPDAAVAAQVLARQPEVEWAQPNFIRRPQATPNDPDYSKQWHFPLINLPAAWDINPGATSDVLVAVIDTGVTERNTTYNWQLWTGSRFEIVPTPYAISSDLDPARIAAGRDFVLFTAGTPVLDMGGHGSHVAGTILQNTDNNAGAAGIAYKARLLPVKVCYDEWDMQIIMSSRGQTGFYQGGSGCPTDAIVNGIRWAADQGANVMNISLGGTGTSPSELEALQYAVGKGTFVAMSAGNNYETGNAVNTPARYGQQLNGAMTVGSVGRSSKRAYYSNTSSGTEIAAPGGDTRDGGTAGLVHQTTIVAADYDWATVVKPRFDRYSTQGYQGTSMAAPHIAGVAALLYSQGYRNPAVIEAAIKRFAKDLGAEGRDDEFGYGLVDTRTTLRGLGVAR